MGGTNNACAYVPKQFSDPSSTSPKHLSKYCRCVLTSESCVGMKMGVPRTADGSHKQSRVRETGANDTPGHCLRTTLKTMALIYSKIPQIWSYVCIWETVRTQRGLGVSWLGVKLPKNKTIHQPACLEGKCTFQR